MMTLGNHKHLMETVNHDRLAYSNQTRLENPPKIHGGFGWDHHRKTAGENTKNPRTQWRV